MIPVRCDKSAAELRGLARLAEKGKEALRFLGIANILDGFGRKDSAELVGMSQTSLERLVKRYNAEGVDGLRDKPRSGRPRIMSQEQEAELKRIILAGPADRKRGPAEFNVRGIVALIKEKFNIRMSPEAVRTRLHGMGLEKLVCRPIHHKTDQAAQDKFMEEFPSKIAKITADHPKAAHIEIWVQDETRVGQKGKVTSRWAEKGSSPRAVVHGGFQSAWLFGAFCPERDAGAAIVVDSVSTEAMNAHLDVISKAVLPGNHAALLVDNAGFHAKSGQIIVPSNITLVPLPPYSPELSPPEGVWKFLKKGILAHRLYRDVAEVMESCCEAWRSLIEEPGRIRSLCSFPWLMPKTAQV
jgi:transposase